MSTSESDLKPTPEEKAETCLPHGSERAVADAQEAEILDAMPDLPPEVRRSVELMFSMQRMSGPMPSPLLQKIEPQHITKLLDSAEKTEQRAYDDAQASRRWGFAYLLVFCAVFVFATVFLVKADKELFKEVMKIGVSFVGGFGGGIGLKSYVDWKKK